MWNALATPVASRPAPICFNGRVDGALLRSERTSPRMSGKTCGASVAMPRLLVVVEDESITPDAELRAFPASDYRVQVIQLTTEGLGQRRIDSPDVILLDSHPNPTGLNAYHDIRQIFPLTPVVFLLTESTSEATIQAMKAGAFDCLAKPLDHDELQRVVSEALEARTKRTATMVSGPTTSSCEVEGTIIGKSPAMQDVFKAIARVAEHDFPVLITGESGTGKELVAHAIHRHSNRASALFRAINCAAIPDQLLESELFGHEKGSFTGADRQRIGKFEQCHRGTLFLDEIGDMSAASQAKILRLTQSQTFERVGGSETICTDVRLVAATHRDLKSKSAAGDFRHDLFYRLGGITIHLPSLRERGADLELLVSHYLRRFNSMLGRSVHEVSLEAMQKLREYSWPGNIRELQSVLKQALLHARGEVLLPHFLPDLSNANPVKPAPLLLSVPPVSNVESFVREQLSSESKELYAETHAYVDRFLLKRVMEHADGNQHRAARQLGIARQTLRSKLRELGLQVKPSIEDLSTANS